MILRHTIVIILLEILYMWCEIKFHIDNIVGCKLAYILGELILLLPFDLGNNKPLYVQVNALDS